MRRRRKTATEPPESRVTQSPRVNSDRGGGERERENFEEGMKGTVHTSATEEVVLLSPVLHSQSELLGQLPVLQGQETVVGPLVVPGDGGDPQRPVTQVLQVLNLLHWLRLRRREREMLQSMQHDRAI